MGVTERLEEIRRTTEGCSVVALADLSTRLVLCAACSDKPPQERLDRLSIRAADLLARPSLPGADVASVVAGSCTEVFVRSAADADDVLCCVCGPNVDISELVRRARRGLADLAARR
ncbi:hypothetical protein [Jhaorihella thermophila]|uniref:hypothetical protein n=1 Tax=Jhaorihella thermophila TaxID=488547 RepID=UPI000CDE995B|nr:hypothetical protein [Jhaorihella thermophila]